MCAASSIQVAFVRELVPGHFCFPISSSAIVVFKSEESLRSKTASAMLKNTFHPSILIPLQRKGKHVVQNPFPDPPFRKPALHRNMRLHRRSSISLSFALNAARMASASRSSASLLSSLLRSSSSPSLDGRIRFWCAAAAASSACLA